ncbi:phage tail tape measure protein [Mesorhizobium sp. B1-1-5]|uniref:phage tail tape measure protein n=1 Tax=Mesorhizobium sp. B1-1-5 TaxID=2589979 RepID=UPI00112C3542|nr:phage tail tape measure protein [Mesorhizobium sp. B1-1-5]TPO02195.1 phage tail tape measure protein [Mesorhizobium sp. B1-1-5]
MAALDVRMVLSLVDKASGPAKGIMSRIFGNGAGKGGKGLEGTTLSANAANGAMLMLNRTMATFAAGAAGYVGFKAMIGGAVDFEDAMADVSKKVNMAPPQIDKLAERIKQLARETPLAATEIARLVAQAGTFGIANEDLERFALLGSKVAIAFDMTADQAADSLAHIKASLKLNMDQLEDYADAINYVADNTAASEEQLVDFVLRTGPGATAAGLSPKDLLAIGSAMTEVGLQSGRAGTAVNAMLTKMTDLGSKKGAGKVIDQLGGKGYSKKLQKEFFENPTKALIKILKLTEQMSRPDRATFMKDLFGLETQDEVAALAGNVGRVVDTMQKLGDTAVYAGSVNKVFESFKNTTKNQWKQFTGNVELAAAVFGAKLLPAINGSLHYLNNFFATAEGRVSIFDRLSASADGFFNGLGYKGGAAEALSGVAETLKGIRDLIFGIEGDGMSGDKVGELFHRWQQFGASLHDTPIATILDAIKNANARDLGGALLAGAAGMGALSIAARIALSPLRGILSIMQGIVKAAYTLSGLRTAKWIFDLIKGTGGPDVAARPGNSLGAWGAAGGSLLVRIAPWLARGTLATGAAYTLFRALEAKGPADNRLFDPSQNANVSSESRARTRNPLTGHAEPAPPSTPVQPAEPFSFGGLWRDLTQPIGPNPSSGPQAVNVNGPVTTVPSGVQQVQVTNPSPAPVINVTVHAVTNASPAAIGSAVGGAVSGALRQNLGDGGM